MSTIGRNLDWLFSGFIGEIPVWTRSGLKVGSRKSFDTLVFTPNANYKGQTDLISRDFWGREVVITVPNPNAQYGGTVAPIPAPQTGTGTGTSTVTGTSPVVTGQTPAVTGQIVALPSVSMPLIIGAGAVAALWLLTSKR